MSDWWESAPLAPAPKFTMPPPAAPTADAWWAAAPLAKADAGTPEIHGYVQDKATGKMIPITEPDTSVPSQLDNVGRSIASGATFGLADEGAAAARSLFNGKSYDENLADERKRDAAIPAFIRVPGEVVGAVATGKAAADAGLTLLRTARPTVGSMAVRGAGEGAAYGAAHGFGHAEGGAGPRLEAALVGAGIGAATGGGTGAVAGKIASRGAEKVIPTTEDLKDAASASYDASKAAGVAIAPESFGNAVDDITAAAVKAKLHPELHPDAAATVRVLQGMKGQPLSLEDVDQTRQIVSDLLRSPKPGEQRIGRIMVDKMDDYLDGLKPSDVVAGDPETGVKALTEARDLWSRFRKSEIIDAIREKAQLAASGVENGERAGFRSLANNAKQMARFTPEEQAAIRHVVEGGKVDNLLKLISKAAPTGIVSSGLGTALGNAIGGAPGAIAVPAIGSVARSAAAARTAANADAVSALVRSGGDMPTNALTPLQQQTLNALIIAQSEEVPPYAQNALSRLGLPVGPGPRR